MVTIRYDVGVLCSLVFSPNHVFLRIPLLIATFLYNRFLQLRRHVGFSIPEALGGSLGPVLNSRTHRNPVAIFTSV